ncbi:MAG TPA: hypothetical protein VMV09_10280, partial [Candidatus Saccharimonadales bacterium]|nr:hypothetical protein [Candidatus Saccharimonadales bacterium]
WRVGASELEEVLEIGKRHGLSTSWEGIAALAAMRQAFSQVGARPSGSWVAILTGDPAQLAMEPWPADDLPFPVAESEFELDELLTAGRFTRLAGT